MPDNKNQHYVPRCHLKPFTLDRAGLAINMFNHHRGIIRENVPVSGQCAKSYFYGEDLVVERHLQTLEGRYAKTIRSIENGEAIVQDDFDFLRNFILLQWCRTDGALRRRREVVQAMDDLSRRGREGVLRETPDMTQLAHVLGSLRIWSEAGETISDLRVSIIRNRSRVDFVTSDDPAVLTNRVFIQRMRDPNFGLSNVGTMFFMPLGPRFAAVCYDHHAYAPVGREGIFLNIDRDQDAKALNELQFLNALSNIYFAGPIGNGTRVQADFAAVAERRPVERFRFWQGISEGVEGEFEVYRRVGPDEVIPPYATTIQAFSPLYPEPAHWVTNLRMRKDIIGWVIPGAVGGPVRRRPTGRVDDARLIRVGIGPLRGRTGQLPDRMYHLLGQD